MMDAATLAFLIDSYFRENPDIEPTAKELANFIVSRNFELTSGADNPDPTLLIRAAIIIIESQLWMGDETKFTIFRDEVSGNVRLQARESGLQIEGRNLSETLLRYCRASARH